MAAGNRIRVDASRPLSDEPRSGHNRWHPDIPPVATVGPGEELTLETRDGLDCAVGPESTVDDVLAIDLRLPHPLTGPVYVEGAEPGDVLAVELLGFESNPFGFTCIVPRFGIAPSLSLMEATHRREDELRARGGAVADEAPEVAVPTLAASGLRTIPPRETGGNMDVRGLVAGSTAYFPVHVPGALFSVGDLHYAQGDGESCGVAVEIAGAATVRFGVRKDAGWPLRFPAYDTPARPRRRCFATTGLPVTPDGRNESLDLGLATRTALLEMIAYLGHEHGLTPEQAYVLVSVAVDLSLSEIVDIPNPLVSALLPLDIFES
jgi:formamidase